MTEVAPEQAWELTAPTLADEAALSEAVVDVHERILSEELLGDPMLNFDLGIQVRAVRRIEDWRVLLLLTPWMLARLLFPDRGPVIAIPPDWTAAARRDADYLVLGPRVDVQLLGQPQKAHLIFHPALGHYLLQPLCLDMSPYRDAEAAFAAWAEVIRIRDENMERAQRDCPMQREVSRRELFTRIVPRDR